MMLRGSNLSFFGLWWLCEYSDYERRFETEFHTPKTKNPAEAGFSSNR
jgi:hypothetical protein